ncbi:MAG: carboxypeptidase-like regulatory domain-containing protein [Candidatus Limnocylindria bacterium]
MIELRALVAILLLTVIGLACTTPSASAPAEVSVRGSAVAGPVCPVERQPPDPACAPHPVEGARIAVIDAQGEQVALATTDASGGFSVDIVPGTYRLVAMPVAGLMGTPAPLELDIGPAGATDIVFEFDTGIR